LFSLVLAYERADELRFVSSSYRWILGRVRNALQSVGPVELAGISDLAIDRRKVSGNAQQRKARHVLHHGTLLYGFELSQVGRYLNAPERAPAYRDGRDHGGFIANLRADAVTLRLLLVDEFGAEPSNSAPLAHVPDLIAERYARTDWVWRR
jgi:lipoate-protein ligase A